MNGFVFFTPASPSHPLNPIHHVLIDGHIALSGKIILLVAGVLLFIILVYMLKGERHS